MRTKGDADAQFNLGMLYSDDRKISMRWFKLAADQGHAGAVAELRKIPK